MYGEAIALDPTNHVYFSNRAAAFANLKKYRESLTDATKTVELKPDWPKASHRSFYQQAVHVLLHLLGILEKRRGAYLSRPSSGSQKHLPGGLRGRPQ